MKPWQPGPRQQQGSATIIGVMLLIVVIVYMLQTTLHISDSSTDSTRLQESGIDALFIAESGLERAARRFSDNTGLCAANGLGEANVELVLGSGRQFTVISDATGLPANQCRLTVTGQVSANNAARTVQAVVSDAGATGVILDAVTSRTRNNQSAVTWNHTVGTGLDRVLLVGISVRRSGGVSINSVTTNGLAMQPLLTPLPYVLTPNADTRVALYWRANPTSGVNAIAVNLSGNARTVAGAVSFSGVDQVDPLESNAKSSATSFNASATVNTLSGDAWVISVLAAHGNSLATVGAGQTELWNDRIGPNNGNRVVGGGSLQGPIALPASVTMNWNGLGGMTPWAMITAAIKPSGNGAAPVVTWTEIVQ